MFSVARREMSAREEMKAGTKLQQILIFFMFFEFMFLKFRLIYLINITD